MMRNKLFICAGVMKTGTSWLCNNMRNHPELYHNTQRKEHNFLVRRPGDKRRIDANWYENLYADATPNQWRCDFSTNTGSASKERWKEILQMGDVRVCCIFRNPIEHLWSAFRYLPDFHGVYELIVDMTPSECIKICENLSILEDIRFGDFHSTMYETIPENRYKVLYHDQIKDSTASRLSMLRDIEDFLEIDHWEYDQIILDRKNKVSKILEMPEWFPSLYKKHLTDQFNKFAATGAYIPDEWKNQMDLI